MAKAKEEQIERVSGDEHIAEKASVDSDQPGLYDPKTFVEPKKEPEEPKKQAPKKVKVIKAEAGEYEMLANVKHDGVIYSSGEEVELDADKATLFKTKGWVK